MNAHAKYIFIDGTFMPTQPSHNQMITQERHVQKQNRRSPWQNLYARRICTHRFMVRFQSVQGVALKKRLQSSNESGTFVNSSNGTHFSPKSLSDRLSRRAYTGMDKPGNGVCIAIPRIPCTLVFFIHRRKGFFLRVVVGGEGWEPPAIIQTGVYGRCPNRPYILLSCQYTYT